MVQQVAIEHQRRQIPTKWLIAFEEITNDELASMAVDHEALPKLLGKFANAADVRAYAGWELEYREAFGIEVYYDGSVPDWQAVACRLDDHGLQFSPNGPVNDAIRRKKL